MLNDDDQLADFLTMNGMMSRPRLEELKLVAHEQKQTLYLMVMLSGEVDEQKLVSMLSATLDIPSVLLHEYEGDPEVLAHVPPGLARRSGVLPVGIAEVDGRAHLYLAMANPHDEESLALLRQGVDLPIIPLLAGPNDLLRAIARNLGGAEYKLDGSDMGQALPVASDEPPIEDVELLDDDDVLESVDVNAAFADGSSPFGAPIENPNDLGLAVPSSPSLPFMEHGDLDNMFEDFSVETSGVQSALSMIDDIPAQRHVAATPPSGLGVAAEPFRSAPPAGSPRHVPTPTLPDPNDRTGIGVPTQGLSGSFRRVEKSSDAPVVAQEPRAHSAESARRTGFSRAAPSVSNARSERHAEWRKAPTALLARSLAQLLVDRGILRDEEIDAEIERQRTLS